VSGEGGWCEHGSSSLYGVVCWGVGCWYIGTLVHWCVGALVLVCVHVFVYVHEFVLVWLVMLGWVVGGLEYSYYKLDSSPKLSLSSKHSSISDTSCPPWHKRVLLKVHAL
jgi:hypothetical protein